ncbi:MAG: hypothetical protein KGR26_04930 [Cyanobacteria bacterium REEB65]|nr:hypothetical protein [Cyanobacteria bacterium REEB65]
MALSLPNPVAHAQTEDPLLEEVLPTFDLGTVAPLEAGPLTWRVSGGDRPQMADPSLDDSAWVARSAISAEPLANRVAWYRFHFEVAPGFTGLGSELLLGGVEGNVDAFLNGGHIGAMRGAVDPPYQRRQTFLLPAVLLRPGDNVLALRITGFTGQPRVGLLRGPVTLAPLSMRYEEDERRQAEAAAASRQSIRQAAAALDRFTAWGSQGTQASMSLSFGRFAGPAALGLLTCQLAPDGFSAATTSLTPMALQGTFGSPSAADRTTLESLSPVGKELRVEQAAGAAFRLYYPLLYPGFAIAPEGATLSVQLHADLEMLYVDPWGISTHSACVHAEIPWVEPWLCFFDPKGRLAPVLLALPTTERPVQLQRGPDRSTTLVLPAGETARFCWPWGIAAHVPSAKAADMARLRQWAAAMVPFALRTDDRVTAGQLHAHDSFEYLEAGTVPYAPLSPVLPFALTGPPEGDPEGSYRGTGMTTLAGILWVASGRTAIGYDLPVPDDGEVPALPKGSKVSSGNLLSGLAEAQADSAVDLAFTGRAEDYLRWAELNSGDRLRLQANTAAQIPRAWSPLSWAQSVEPRTGTTFSWTAARLQDGQHLADFGLGNGLAIYGTALAAQVGDDWGMVRTNWAAIGRAFQWFPDSFDWAWQASCDSVGGKSTGDGETLAAGYLAALGMARMAKVVDPGAEEGYLAMAARMAVLVENRPKIALWAHSHGLLAPFLEAAGLDQSGIEAGAGPGALFGALAELPDLHCALREGRLPWTQTGSAGR